MIRREMGALSAPCFLSLPEGGGSLADAVIIEESNASRLDLPARVSDEVFPPGRKKSSNFAIAPEDPLRSFAWRTWVVDFHPGPRICRAINRQHVVLPIPAGPANKI